MGIFNKKTWADRISEFPTRRQLTKEDGSTEVVTVARQEGTIMQTGDAFNAENMNDLENRVEDAVDKLNSNFMKIVITQNPSITQLKEAKGLVVILNNGTTAKSSVAFIADGKMQITWDVNGTKKAATVIWSRSNGTITYSDSECSTFGCIIFS